MSEQLSNVQEIGVNARCGCSVPKLCVGQHRRHAATSAGQRPTAAGVAHCPLTPFRSDTITLSIATIIIVLLPIQ